MGYLRKGISWLFGYGWIARLINHPLIQILFPAITGAYFLVLDIWGEKWEFISKNIAFHEKLFVYLLLATLASQIFITISKIVRKTKDDDYLKFLEGFMVLTASVVAFKLNRFSRCAPRLKKKSNTFKTITQPKEQIEYIIDQSSKWLKESFGLHDDQISFTVIKIDGRSNSIFYLFESSNSWKRTRAKDIVSGDTAASYCLGKGEPIYFPDKSLAAKKGRYFMSERDARRSNGSVYCYPVFVNTPDYKDKYVISIVTYGKLLSDPRDDEASKIIKSIFAELCRRIELELTLATIRAWQFGE